MPTVSQAIAAMFAAVVALNAYVWQPLPLVEVEWKEYRPWWEKINLLWEEHLLSPIKSTHFASDLEISTRLQVVGEDMRNLFRPSTFRDTTRKAKFFHAQGMTGRVVLRWTNPVVRSKYTGLFAETSDLHGFLRFSTGDGNIQAPFGIMLNIPRTDTTPGILMGLQSVIYLESNRNGFQYLKCSHHSPSGFLNATTSGMSRFHFATGSLDFAQVSLNGSAVKKPVVPFVVCFRPNAELATRVGELKKGSPFYEDAATQAEVIRKGDLVYTVFLIDTPAVLSDSKRIKDPRYVMQAGEVRAESVFGRSSLMEYRLKGAHFLFEHDVEVRPDWLPHLTWSNLFYSDAGLCYHQLALHQPRVPYEYVTPQDVINMRGATGTNEVLRWFGNISNPSAALSRVLSKANNPRYFDEVPQCHRLVGYAGISAECLDAIVNDLGRPFGIFNMTAFVELKSGYLQSQDPEASFVSALISTKASEAHLYSYFTYWDRNHHKATPWKVTRD